MPYLDCPECHASFHTGLLYLKHDSCPRCGAPLDADRRHLGESVRNTVLRRHRPAREPLDWETITRFQYTHPEYVTRAHPVDDPKHAA